MIAFARQDETDIVDDWSDLDTFEPIRRRGGELPVRSHASRIKARRRSRGSAAARLKARSMNGVHRRHRSVWTSCPMS
jgi:hypothetical protein